MSEEQAVKNKHLYFKNTELDYFLQYALACQTYQGSAYGECFSAASQVHEENLESWVQAWTAEAQKAEAYGKNAEASGHRISSRETYLRAATYYAVALIAMSPRDSRYRQVYETYRTTFRRSAALQDTPIEAVQIPFEGKSLSGYFLRATDNPEKRPTIIMLGDRFAEELYFWGGAPAAVSRGYHVLLVDQPGQGITPFDGLHTRVDAEVPVRAIVDYLYSRNDVDLSHIALYGIATAGYMATRAATVEKRISACIADTPLDNMESVMMAEVPSSSPLPESDMALRSVLFDFTSWQAGKTQLPELFELFKGMKVDDVSKITCPMLCLVSTGEVAERIRQTQNIYELLPNPKKALHVFTEEEGADAHNQVNNLGLLHEIAFDWLDEVYNEG